MAVNGTATLHDGMVAVSGHCERCGLYVRQDVPSRAWHGWRAGTLTIDEAFPAVAHGVRSFLVEGICGPCHAADLAEEAAE